jgi:hypothetical protein
LPDAASHGAAALRFREHVPKHDTRVPLIVLRSDGPNLAPVSRTAIVVMAQAVGVMQAADVNLLYPS